MKTSLTACFSVFTPENSRELRKLRTLIYCIQIKCLIYKVAFGLILFYTKKCYHKERIIIKIILKPIHFTQNLKPAILLSLLAY